MRVASYIGLVVGLTIFVGLVTWQGIGDLLDLLLSSGWALLLVPVAWFPTVLMNARCWQLLFLPPHGPNFGQAFYAQWMGRAVNTLLPVASIGGEVVKARVLVLWGIDGKHSSASAVVDKTVQALTTIVWRRYRYQLTGGHVPRRRTRSLFRPRTCNTRSRYRGLLGRSKGRCFRALGQIREGGD